MNLRSHSTHEQAVLELARARPLLRARDLAQQELPTVVLSRLVTAGKLERVARGVYGLPGQAISYKVGERVWLAGRAAAQARHGAAFDLKAFHRYALDLGPLGLDLLETELAAF